MFCTNGTEYVNGNFYCFEGGKSCSLFLNGSCFQCKRGYYLKNDICMSCVDNCLLCFDDETCIRCIDQYVFSSDQKKCIQKTLQESDLNNLFFKVFLENNLYTFFDKSLFFKRRNPNCISFDIKGICVSCGLRYFLGFDSECFPCSDNCIKCTNHKTCQLCDDNFSLNFSQNGESYCIENVNFLCLMKITK